MSVRPLEGRRFYFVGIGGAGLSAYANFARAWGAQVAGWDVRETIFLGSLDEVAVDLVPVFLGEGRPYFTAVAGTVLLDDATTVIAGERVTHLVYPVRRG